MSERSFDQRARAWLELGPSRAPIDAVEAVLSAIETVPQQRPMFGPGGLRRRSGAAGRRRFARSGPALALVAAAGLVAAVLVGTLLGQRTPEVATTPSPSNPSPSTTPLRDTTGLLAAYPELAVRLSASVGFADAPISAETALERIELGHLDLQGPFGVGMACRGPGELTFEIRWSVDMDLDRDLFMNRQIPCDGRPTHDEYLALPPGTSAPDPGRPPGAPVGGGQEVTITVAAGASWRVAIGEYPAALRVRPNLPPVDTTDGWTRLLDEKLVLDRINRSVVEVPAGATRLAVIVQCTLEARVSVIAAGAWTDVACPTDAARVEFPVTGGSTVEVRARSEEVTWIQLAIEANGATSETSP